MRLLIILALALLGSAAPCFDTSVLAQSPSQGPPDFGIDTSGVLRKLSVRDATLGSRVPLAVLDTTTHSFAAPVVLVESYGAISGDALDDKAAIQAAVTAATAAGRCVSGSSRTYLINGNIVLPNGACLQDIKLVETGTGIQRPITSDAGPGPFTLRRVRVDRGLSDSRDDSAGIWLTFATNSLFEDVEVTGNGAGKGIQLSFSQNVKLVRPWIHDMEWTNTTGVDPGIEQITGLVCSTCSNLEVIDPRIENIWGTIPWVAGQNLAPSQGYPWRTNAGKAYRATATGGASGTTAPTCTSGTCSDGLKTWQYMGPAATTKRSYQADGTGFSEVDHVSIRGGLIRNTWEGADIGGSNDVWLYGVTFMDIDSWGEKWCHHDTNSGSIGSRIFRPGITGVVTCGEDTGPIYIAHHRVIDALVTDPGSNGNWAGTHAGFWTGNGTDIQFINTAVIDSQTVPTMTQGYRSDAISVPLGTILINPYALGATARSGTWGGILEGPYGTAVAANTGTSGHTIPYLDVANIWSAQQRTVVNAAAAQSIPLALGNNGGSAASVAIDLDPNGNGVGTRSAQIASAAAGGSDASLIFRTANGGAPSQAAAIGPFGSGKGGLMVGQASVTDPGIGSVHAQAGFQVTALGVASLPACSATFEGMMRGVTDANSTTYNATAAGGGANHMPVYCNGTNWVLH